jgi:hypothetical protein
VVVAALALAPRLRTAGRFETQDEILWLRRSLRFSEALQFGHLGDASASTGHTVTMPGVTTMWIGALARYVWSAGRRMGLWAEPETRAGTGVVTFLDYRSGLVIAHVGMAVATAALIGLLVVLVSRWAGRTAAAIAGVLLATEPFLVAHGTILHTDELLALFAVNAFVATALALGLPERTSWTGNRWVAVAAGASFGAALLTKISAVVFVPGIALLGVWAAGRAFTTRGGGASWPAFRTLCGVAAWWVGGAVATGVLAYPAFWVNPIRELAKIRRSAGLAGDGHAQFFHGHMTLHPGPAYYLVALPLRMTPWFLAAAAVAMVAVWCRRASRGFAVALTCLAVPPFATLSVADTKFDRYGLPALVAAALAVGIVTAPAVHALRRRFRNGPRLAVAGGALAAAAVSAHTLAVAPWGIAYFNPVLGGSATAVQTVMVGWGEGLERAGDLIARREAGRCESVIVHSYRIASAYRCGSLARYGDRPTYVVTYVSVRQRWPDRYTKLVRGRELLAAIQVRGITYAEVYGPPAASR